jgi:ATP-dependent DNA helicase RecG
MNRLLHGDVGSGKTVVALAAMLGAVENGRQAALMAPTQILAEQHFRTAQAWLEPLGLGVALRTAARSDDGTGFFTDRRADVVIGTHALLHDEDLLHNLGLVVIDEQHKFGVAQRARLIQKGRTPDVLVMTATPIPRTLSLTLDGDLDVSVIDELPPGRKPVKTKQVSADQIERVWSFVKKQVDEGRQAYVVYPVIEESETKAMKAAQQMYEHLSGEVFPGVEVGLMHGRLPAAEKEAIMARFKGGETKILVSTTVIEVGVDVPNATVMVVEEAERFGLAQLHQLRGRVGRGAGQSYCILATGRMNDVARERIRTLVDSNDGFHIAEMDLKLRGPGEFFGTRQAGLPSLRVANILRDQELLEAARRDAMDFVANPPSEEALERAAAYVREHWRRHYGLVTVG